MHRTLETGDLMPPLAAFEARAAAFRAAPGLAPAVARYCREMAEVDSDGWPTIKLFNQFGRYMIGFLLIHHYQDWRHHGGPSPTLARLQATSRLSPRQTASIVGGLRVGRLLANERVPGTRNAKLVPAPALTAVIARSMLAFVRAADAIEGPTIPPRAPALEANVDLQNELVYRSARFVFAHGSLLDDYPAVRHFTAKDCGYLVLTAVMAVAYAGPETAPALSCRSLAGHFRVSRSHIGNLLAMAIESEWFATDRRGRLRYIQPGFVKEFERWAASELGHYATIADSLASPENDT